MSWSSIAWRMRPTPSSQRVDHRRVDATPFAALFLRRQGPAGGDFLPTARRLDRLKVGVERQVLLLRLQRRVRCVERNVEKERRLAARVAVDEPDRVPGHQVRDVALLEGGLVAVKPVPFSEPLLGEVVDRRVVTHGLREAAPQRVVVRLM